MSFQPYLNVEIDFRTMNNNDNYNMTDFMQEEIAVRDYLLRKAHPVPNVQDELKAFMQEHNHLEGLQDTDELSDEKASRSTIYKIGIGAILAIAASLLFLFILDFGKQKSHLVVPEGAVVAYEADASLGKQGITLQKGDEEPVMMPSNKISCDVSAQDVMVRNVLTTPSNATAEVTLADGTVVTVNAGSRLTYPQSFKGKTREVELQGEAFFQVHHDAQHPFIVRSNGVATQVLGTEFNVRSYEKTHTHVTLLEGSVLVSTSKVNKRIVPGEDAAFDGSSLQVRTVDAEEFTAWKDGEFYFDNVSLLTVAKEIGKWYNVSVIFQSPEKMHTRLFFAAPRDGSIQELLEVLNGLNKAKFTYHDGQVVIE